MSAEAVHPDEVIDGSQVDVVERVLELTDGRGADVVITATAANVTQEQAIAMAARNGRISFFGGLPKTDPYHPLRLQRRALPPAAHPRRQRLGARAQQARARLHRDRPGAGADLITERVPLERVLDAFAIVEKGAAIKVTVEP